MLTNIKNMLNDDQGATLVEYGLLVALVAAVCIAIVATVGKQVLAAFTTVSGQLPAVASGT
jgi:pilus assembly protein Flp/PilA